MKKEDGFTTTELLVVTALLVALMAMVVTFSVPMLARETMTSGIYEIQNHVQLARVEAVSRNRTCRFVVDTNNRTIRVLDSMGTAATNDDVVLHDAILPPTVTFASPDAGTPVTMQAIGGGRFGAAFRSDGTVTSGSGEIRVFGGNEFRRVRLFAGGGIGLDKWSGSAWVVGT